MRKKYILGVFISVVLIFLNQIIIQFALDSIDRHAKQINIAGRQRMLSQKLNLGFYKLNQHLIGINEIEKDFDLWKNSHYSLINGNESIRLEKIKEERVIEELQDLNIKIQTIENIINQYKQNTTLDLAKIDENQRVFLTLMDDCVHTIERYAGEEINFIVILEISLALLTILVIALEVRFIYFPQANFLNQSRAQILEQNKVLKDIAWQQSHETRKPVANILGLCDLLTKNNLSEEDKTEALHHLKNSAEELDAVIKQIISKTHSTKEK